MNALLVFSHMILLPISAFGVVCLVLQRHLRRASSQFPPEATVMEIGINLGRFGRLPIADSPLPYLALIAGTLIVLASAWGVYLLNGSA